MRGRKQNPEGEGLGLGLFSDATGADFSGCGKYRYSLWRIWDDRLPVAVFIMMNPSTADDIHDDPTVTRCQRRVRGWKGPKVGGVEVVNVFAWRETDSRLLPGLIKNGVDIIGPANDAAILKAARRASIVVCGWGNPGNLLQRGAGVLKTLREAGISPFALKINQDGTPQHPLYIGYDQEPIPC